MKPIKILNKKILENIEPINFQKKMTLPGQYK
jgi:hypothetical protein